MFVAIKFPHTVPGSTHKAGFPRPVCKKCPLSGWFFGKKCTFIVALQRQLKAHSRGWLLSRNGLQNGGLNHDDPLPNMPAPPLLPLSHCRFAYGDSMLQFGWHLAEWLYSHTPLKRPSLEKWEKSSNSSVCPFWEAVASIHFLKNSLN